MKNIVVVCASFHEEHVKKMLNHVETEVKDKNLEITHIQWVPGSFELPLAMNRLLSRTDIAAGICLGIIEKGETQHGEAIGNALMKSLLDIQINQNKPIGLGVIGPGTEPHHITSRIDKHAKCAVSAICALL